MSFITLLKSNKNARKIFGKKELGIITKQLQGMPLTQSERNRLSRDIRPKLAFIKDISIHQEDFHLEKNHENKKLMQQAVETILQDEQKNNVKAIFLFGSFADHSFTQRSDIDICVLFHEQLSLREATKFRIRVSGSLSEKMDIQVFSLLPQKIKREIAKKHKVLFQSSNYDGAQFTLHYLKDEDYFIRTKNIFGVKA